MLWPLPQLRRGLWFYIKDDIWCLLIMMGKHISYTPGVLQSFSISTESLEAIFASGMVGVSWPPRWPHLDPLWSISSSGKVGSEWCVPKVLKYEWSFSETPLSLQSWCRLAIRRAVGRVRLCVSQLWDNEDLPQKILRFIRFQDFFHDDTGFIPLSNTNYPILRHLYQTSVYSLLLLASCVSWLKISLW